MYNNKDRKLKTGSDIIKKLNIVLYTPEIPQNTGNISRTCAVTGAAMHIIRPTGFEISDRTLKRAGLDYWDKLEVFYYDSYADFLDKVGPDAPLFFFSSKGKRCYTEAEYPDGAYIVFGCETRGLPAELIEENLHRTYRLPMRETLRCLNLSNAVAIVTYEVLRSWDFEGLV